MPQGLVVAGGNKKIRLFGLTRDIFMSNFHHFNLPRFFKYVQAIHGPGPGGSSNKLVSYKPEASAPGSWHWGPLGQRNSKYNASLLFCYGIDIVLRIT